MIAFVQISVNIRYPWFGTRQKFFSLAKPHSEKNLLAR